MKSSILTKVHGILVAVAFAITISAAATAVAQQSANASSEHSAALVLADSEQASGANSDQEAPSSVSCNHDRSTRWERNLRYDGAQLVEVQSGYATACYTPVGSCLLANLVPQGAACWCPSPSGAVWGRAW